MGMGFSPRLWITFRLVPSNPIVNGPYVRVTLPAVGRIKSMAVRRMLSNSPHSEFGNEATCQDIPVMPGFLRALSEHISTEADFRVCGQTHVPDVPLMDITMFLVITALPRSTVRRTSMIVHVRSMLCHQIRKEYLVYVPCGEGGFSEVNFGILD